MHTTTSHSIRDFSILLLFVGIGYAFLYLLPPVEIQFINSPKPKQLYPRTLAQDSPFYNQALIPIIGQLKMRGNWVNRIEVEIFRGDVKDSSFYIVPNKSEDAPHTYSFGCYPRIRAERINYRIELHFKGRGCRTQHFVFDDLLAGDTYIIQGQSNAAAMAREGNANENQTPFVRSFGRSANCKPEKGQETWCRRGDWVRDENWYIAEGNDACIGGSIGQWGMRMASVLSEQTGIPLAIFNGADGGKQIACFQKNLPSELPNDINNYHRLWHRLYRSGLSRYIRGVIWWQGTRDAVLQTDPNAYIAAFDTLYTTWLGDYPTIEHIYSVQMREGCGVYKGSKCPTVSKLPIQEAQRRIDLDPRFTTIPVTVLASTGLDNYIDGCHIGYEKGHKQMGDWLARLLKHDFYGLGSGTNIRSPHITTIKRSDTNELVLSTSLNSDTLLWTKGAEQHFQLHSPTGLLPLISGRTEGNQIFLQYEESSQTSPTHLSYLGDTWSLRYHTPASCPCDSCTRYESGPNDIPTTWEWVTNTKGLGLLCFERIPIQ